jgi:hypothetical protein
VFHLVLTQPLRESGRPVHFVVVVETKESEIIFLAVLVVAVQVCDLPFLNLVPPFQPEAEAAAAAALREDVHLRRAGYRFTGHRQTSRFKPAGGAFN